MINDSKFKEKVMFKLGQIDGKVGGMEKKLKNVCDTVADNTKKVNKHDVFFGKIGVGITAGLFVIVVASNFIIDWIKSKIFS